MMTDWPKVKQYESVSAVNSHSALAPNPVYFFKAVSGKKVLYTWQKGFGLYSTYLWEAPTHSAWVLKSDLDERQNFNWLQSELMPFQLQHWPFFWEFLGNCRNVESAPHSADTNHWCSTNFSRMIFGQIKNMAHEKQLPFFTYLNQNYLISFRWERAEAGMWQGRIYFPFYAEHMGTCRSYPVIRCLFSEHSEFDFRAWAELWLHLWACFYFVMSGVGGGTTKKRHKLPCTSYGISWGESVHMDKFHGVSKVLEGHSTVIYLAA